MGKLTFAIDYGRQDVNNPYADGSVTFILQEIVGPEAVYRISLYRARVVTARDGRPIDPPGDYVVNLRNSVIAGMPVISEKTESFFGEALVDGFEFKIYDSTNPADVVSTGAANAGESGSYPIILAPQNNYKLFTTWIRPKREADVYCRIEIKENGQTDFEEMVTGVLKGAVSGDDVFLEHEQDHNIRLNTTTNREYNTERVWSLKFAPVQMNGLTKVPVRPTAMTFWDPRGELGPVTTALPYDTFANITIEQGVFSFRYKNTLTQNVYARWNRHINANKWLTMLWDEAFGEDKWVFECEDSPMEFQIASLNEDLRTVTPTGQWLTPNVGPNATPEQWVLLPQALWGFHDNFPGQVILGYGTVEPVPNIKEHWKARFRSSWETVIEFCYHYGWLPLIDWDRSASPPKVKITFKDRTRFETSFDTLVPVTSSPEAFYEAETGIAIERLETFLNQRDDQGWCDDWFAMRGPAASDALRDGLDTTDVVTKPQSNAYVVPGTAQKPAKLETLMIFGGHSTASVTHPSGAGYQLMVVGWYNMSLPNYSQSVNRAAGDAKPEIEFRDTTENWPSLTPLMASGAAADPAVAPGNMMYLFGPVMLGRFRYTKSDGTTAYAGVDMTAYTGQPDAGKGCTSFRQLLARFYAPWFVRIDSKYKRKYATITQFTNPDTETVTWRNTRSFYTTNLPVTEASNDILVSHWASAITRDLGANETDIETQLAVKSNSFFDNGWQDEDEQIGDVPGAPPDEPLTRKIE